MEFALKNKSLSAMMIAATAMIINYVLSAVLQGLVVSSALNIIMDVVLSAGGMFLAGMLFFRVFLKKTEDDKTLLNISAYTGIAVLLIGYISGHLNLTSFSFLLIIAAYYICARIFLNRTIFKPAEARTKLRPAGEAGIPEQKAAADPAAKTAKQAANAAEKKNNTVIAAVIILLVLVLGYCSVGGSGSSSGRKWSDLTETEKDNARWAYEVQQALNGSD